MTFSIITVNYNNCDGLKQTIQSVISQTFDDYEYIIIDGGSTDGSKDVILQNANQIDYWVSEPDKGIYNAMNKGIKVSQGEYIIFMNSGDCFYNGQVLHKVSKCMDNASDFIAGNYSINGKIKKSPSRVTGITFFYSPEASICHQALFTKHNILINNPFQEQYKIVADYVNQYHSLILNNAKYQYINETICIVEPGGLSAIGYQKLSEEIETYLHSVLPCRIYDDYTNFMSVKLIQTRYNELYKLLNKYHFSTTDITLTTRFLKFVGFLKEIKIKLLSLIHV
jgi:glycosyltransferase involved in cell wall biosynthesis